MNTRYLVTESQTHLELCHQPTVFGGRSSVEVLLEAIHCFNKGTDLGFESPVNCHMCMVI